MKQDFFLSKNPALWFMLKGFYVHECMRPSTTGVLVNPLSSDAKLNTDNEAPLCGYQEQSHSCEEAKQPDVLG